MRLRTGLLLSVMLLPPLSRVSRNISRRRAARQSAIDQQVNELLAEIAHEMRQPLSAAIPALHLLRRHVSDAQSNAAWLVLERQFKRLSRLVDDLGEITRSRLTVEQLRLERLDLRRVVEEVSDAIQAPLAAKHQHFDIELPPRPVWVEADWARLQQVLSNLLLNGIKYTPPQGRLSVRLSEDSGRAVLKVRDTGRGIKQEFIPKIFEPFATGEQADTHGLGVGLAVARRFVELHGGTIRASSDGVGRGSEFVVMLPTRAHPGTTPGHERRGSTT